MLIIFMIKSSETLEYVVESLINDKPIKGNNGPSIPVRRRSVSPSGLTGGMNGFSDLKKMNTHTPQNQSALIRR